MRRPSLPSRIAVPFWLLCAIPASAEAPVGPWRSLPLLERAQVVAISASPARPGRWLMAAEGGGVFRSEDGGSTWLPAGAGLPPDIEIRLMAGSPADASVFFAAPAGRRVFRTTDSGATWVAMPTLPPGTVLGALLPDASDPLVLRAGVTEGSPRGVWLSTDGGLSWTPTGLSLADVPVRALAARHGTSPALLAGTTAGIARSTDAGQTWSVTWAGASVSEIDWDIPSSPDLVRARRAGAHLLESTDAGASWSTISTPVRPTGLATNPANPAEIFFTYTSAACGYGSIQSYGGVQRSTDRGVSWETVVTGSCTDTYPNLYSDEAQAAMLHVEPVAAGTRVTAAWKGTRVVRSDAEGNPGTWAFVDGGLHAVPITRVRAGAGDRWYARSPLWQSLFVSTDGGSTWLMRTTGSCEGPVFSFEASGTVPGLLYESGDDWCGPEGPGGCGTHCTYARCSTDGGAAWSPPAYESEASLPGLWCTPVHLFAMAGSDARVVYAWSEQCVYRRDDPAGEFQFVGAPGVARTAVVVDTNPLCVYAAFAGPDPVRLTTDGGATWAARSDGLPRDDVPVRLLLHATDPFHVLVAFQRHGAFESTDGGSMWTTVPMRLEPLAAGASAAPNRRQRAFPLIRDAAWDTSNDIRRVFLATSRGVAIEGLGMVTAGLTSLDVTSIDYSAARGVLLAGTAAHGAFALELPPAAVAGSPALAAPGVDADAPHVVDLLPSPNPFRRGTCIRFATPRPGAEALLRIFDVTGRTVRTLYRGAAHREPMVVEWDGRCDDGRTVPAGVYFVNLHTSSGDATRRVVAIR